MKPPFQGVALDWLMDHCDLSVIPDEEKKYVYERMSKWTEFFFNFRDLDGDGVWENQGPIETGWEDAAYFFAGFPLASPDMNAYTVRMMGALARLGRSIGVPEAECKAWEDRADILTQKIIDKFWNGERWVAVNTRTGAVGDSLSLPLPPRARTAPFSPTASPPAASSCLPNSFSVSPWRPQVSRRRRRKWASAMPAPSGITGCSTSITP